MIRIVTDTTAGLPRDVLEAYDIPLIWQYVVFGEESFREYFELDASEFYTRQAAADDLPKTSAPTVGDVKLIFEQIFEESPGASLLVICPSAEVSGTVRSSQVAADMFPEADIRIFDTRSISLGAGMMVIEAAQMVRDGVALDTIMARLAYMRDHMQLYFVVDTLEYLHKGGRIGRAAHLVGTMLDLKPVLTLRDGVVESHSKQRTRRRALKALEQLVIDSCQGSDGVHLAVMSAVCEDDAQAMSDSLVKALNPAASYYGELGPAIGVHAGPRALGVCWYIE